MNKDWVARPYVAGDEEQIIPLLKLAFDDWRQREGREFDFWKWMYVDNPSKSNTIYVAVCDDKIIAADHTLSLNIKINDVVMTCSYGTDVVVHPDYRRMGVYSKIKEESLKDQKLKGIKYSYLYTENPIVIKIYTEKRNDDSPISFPHGLSRFIRINDVKLHLEMKQTKNAWLMRLGYQTLKTAGAIKSALGRSQMSTGDLQVSFISKFDERVDDFWEKVSRYYRFISVRDREYLNWRYCDPRAGEYRVLQAEYDGGVLGYTVLAISEKTPGYPEGYILDLLSLPDRLEAVDALVSEAVRYFDSKGINSVRSLMVKDHQYQAVLQKNGFIDNREKLNVFFIRFAKENGLMSLSSSPPSTIHFSQGDTYIL